MLMLAAGDAELPEGGLSGAHQAGGAAQAAREDVGRQAHHRR